MNTNAPMTQERLDAIRELVESMWNMDPHFLAACAREHFPVMLAEVEQLRALTTMNDDMVKRAKRAFGAATAQVSSIPLGMSGDTFIDSVGLQHQHAIRAALDAAIGRWHDYPPCNATPATEAK